MGECRVDARCDMASQILATTRQIAVDAAPIKRRLVLCLCCGQVNKRSCSEKAKTRFLTSEDLAHDSTFYPKGHQWWGGVVWG